MAESISQNALDGTPAEIGGPAHIISENEIRKGLKYLVRSSLFNSFIYSVRGTSNFHLGIPTHQNSLKHVE